MAQNENKKSNSSSHERCVRAYLDPSSFKFLEEYVNSRNTTCSSAINDAVRALKEQLKTKSSYK